MDSFTCDKCNKIFKGKNIKRHKDKKMACGFIKIETIKQLQPHKFDLSYDETKLILDFINSNNIQDDLTELEVFLLNDTLFPAVLTGHLEIINSIKKQVNENLYEATLLLKCII